MGASSKTMKIVIRGAQRRIVEFSGRKKVEQVLQDLRLNPETLVVVRGDELLTRDEVVEDTDTLEIISAISGG